MKLIERITAAFHAIAYDIVALYNAPSYIHNSGRVYCYSDKRWVTDSDDNYGVNYYQFQESGTTSANPIIEWEHKGVLLNQGAVIRTIDIAGHSNSPEIEDMEILIAFRYPTNVSSWNTGFSTDATMTNVIIHRDFFYNAVSSVPVFTGNSALLRKRKIFLNYKAVADGFLSVYFKPVGINTVTRYWRCAYTYAIVPNNPNV